MRYLLLSILVVCVIGVMVPSTFAKTNNSQEDSELYFHKGQAFLNHGYWIPGLENLENALALAKTDIRFIHMLIITIALIGFEIARNYNQIQRRAWRASIPRPAT